MTLDLKHLRKVSLKPDGGWGRYWGHYRAAVTPATTIALLDEIERLRAIADAAENVSIAWGMGWDLDGVIQVMVEALTTGGCEMTPQEQGCGEVYGDEA